MTNKLSVHYNEASGWSIYLGDVLIKSFGFDAAACQEAYEYVAKKEADEE